MGPLGAGTTCVERLHTRHRVVHPRPPEYQTAAHEAGYANDET